MPQAGAGSWRSHGIISLYGKGSLHADLLEATFRTRRRADKRNHCEGRHQRLITKCLERHQKAERSSMERELARTRRAVEEKEALLDVLQSFRGDKLQTMRFGFRPELVTPENIQRCRMERRVLQRGFSVGTLYPEVLKALQERKLERKPRQCQDTLLKDARLLSDFVIDRRITNGAMKHERMIQERQQMKEWLLLRSDSIYNQQSGNGVTRPKPLICDRSTPLPPIRRDNDGCDPEVNRENSNDTPLPSIMKDTDNSNSEMARENPNTTPLPNIRININNGCDSEMNRENSNNTPLRSIMKDTDSSDSEMARNDSSTDQNSQTSEERDFVSRLTAKRPLPPIAKESLVLVQTETSVATTRAEFIRI